MNLPINNKPNKNKRNKRLKIPKNPRQLPVVMPPTWICFHKYVSTVVGASGVGPYLSEDFYINSIVSPEVSGTDTSHAIGTTQMATLYYYWIVKDVKVEFDVSNEEDFEINVFMAPSDLRIKTNITSASLAAQVGELPYGKGITLSRNSGQNRGRITIHLNNAKFLGDFNLYNGDISYRGTKDTNRPVSKQFITFSAAALAGNLTNGITFKMSITYKVKWSVRIFSDGGLMQTLTLENNENNEENTKLQMLEDDKEINKEKV